MDQRMKLKPTFFIIAILLFASGFYFGARAAGDQFLGMRNMVFSVRGMEQANSYISTFSEKGDLEAKADVLDYMKLHLMGVKGFHSDVPRKTQYGACEIQLHVLKDKEKIISFSNQFQSEDEHLELLELLEEAAKCKQW